MGLVCNKGVCALTDTDSQSNSVTAGHNCTLNATSSPLTLAVLCSSCHLQTFNQDASNPGILYNHGNEYLHYQDDWYILASKPNDYVFVYYKGTNDAWSGYGGATVYTKTRELDPALIPELSKAAESAGLKWADFKLTDNSCKPHPPKKDLVKVR